MVDVKISALGAIGTVAGEDLVAIIDDPSGTPVSKKATIDQIKTYIDPLTASSTATFTNKTFDVEATGNSISNIDVADLKAGVLDTDLTSVSASDDTLPSAKAVKTYVDAQIATEDTLAELNDTTITSVGDNEILQYNSTSSVWENQTLAEAGISPVAGSTSITTLGTISTGTWEATDVAIAHGGTGSSTAQAAINAISQVSSATNEHVLTKDTSTGNATWKAASTVAAVNDLTDVTITGAAKGDILVYNGSAWVDLTVGSDGQVLKAASAQSTGLEWGAGGGGATATHAYTNQSSTTYRGTGSSGTGIDVGTAVGTEASGAGEREIYIRKIDTNNEGVFTVIHKNGATVEVQIA